MSQFSKDNEKLYEDVQEILDNENNEKKQDIINIRKALKLKPLSEARLDEIVDNEDDEELYLKEMIEKLKAVKSVKAQGKKKKKKTRKGKKRKTKKTRRGRK